MLRPQPVTGWLSKQLFFPQHFALWRPWHRTSDISACVSFATTVRELRTKQKFGQEAFADHCGLHRTAISLVERGKREPSISTSLKISRGFGLTLSEFLRGVDGVPKKKHP